MNPVEEQPVGWLPWLRELFFGKPAENPFGDPDDPDRHADLIARFYGVALDEVEP